MDQYLGTITCAVTAHVKTMDLPPVPLPAELQYGIDAPYAVRLTLGASTEQSVAWVFARELLVEGTRRPAGLGDVRVMPRHCHHANNIRVVLGNSAGVALVDLSAPEVTAFLQQTFTLVPAGAENTHMDLDRVVTELIGESS
jgi:hypothetical protein